MAPLSELVAREPAPATASAADFSPAPEPTPGARVALEAGAFFFLAICAAGAAKGIALDALRVALPAASEAARAHVGGAAQAGAVVALLALG
jgi:hypothetical protein